MWQGGKITKALKTDVLDAKGYVTPKLLEELNVRKKLSRKFEKRVNLNIFSDDVLYTFCGIKFRFSNDGDVKISYKGKVYTKEERIKQDDFRNILDMILRDIKINQILDA